MEARPLLYEEHGGAGDAARITVTAEWGSGGGDSPHSYTDLHLLTRSMSEKASTAASGTNTRNELGTINGVYVPCLLNIIGVILFLRLGWGVGQAGVEGFLIIFFVAEAQAVLTVLSASAIASNGSMQGGGSYFLISRSLGPEFGGAIGIQFYFLYAVGVAMYLVGFAEEAQQTWFPDPSMPKKLIVILVATGALVLIVIIAFIGANAFARVNKYLFIFQFATVAIGALFIYLVHPHELKSGGQFVGPSMDTLSANMEEHFTSEQGVCGENEVCTLAGVYSIVFPLATGFMEGLNLSGDLKNPGRSLPVGTLAAVGTSCVIYLFLILTFAASFPGETLRNNFSFFQEVSQYPFVVIFGVLVSCFSSGLGALFGASRILQAIARDDLFRSLDTMKQGSASGDEPQHAVLFTCVLAQVFICLGDLDVIAPICTSFFCLAYAGVNLTCFLLQVTGVPNFRPTFRYHTWHLSLLGTVLNLGVMIYLNAVYAVVSLLILTCIFVYLCMTVSPKSWGDISQALIYHQVRKYLLRLDTRKAHSKFWRPSILLLTNEIDCAEVKLCHNLKKGGLYIIGNVITGVFGLPTSNRCGEKYSHWLGYIFDAKLKAIPQVIVAKDPREGYRMLMQTSGLGGMQINTVVLPWVNTGFGKASVKMRPNLIDVQLASDYVGLIVDGIMLRKTMVVVCHTDQVDPRLFRKQLKRGSADPEPDSAAERHPAQSRQTIDVWITNALESPSVKSSAALMLQLAYVLHSNKQWKRHTKIRLLSVCSSTNPKLMQKERLRLLHTTESLRIPVPVEDIVVVSGNANNSILAEVDMPPLENAFASTASVVELNQVLQRNSTHTAQVLLMLPDPQCIARDDAAQAKEYLTKLELLTNNLPSTMLVFNEDETSVISTDI